MPRHAFGPFLLALLFASPAMAQPQPDEGACIVFEHSEFRGAAVSVSRDAPVSWVGNHWNDRVSSVACARKCTLEAYEHRDFAGDRERFRGDTRFVGQRWNDRISSMKVRCGGHGSDDPGPVQPGGGKGVCIAFEHRDFGGSWLRLESGWSMRKFSGAWNDRISSFQCDPGCGVTAFEHTDFAGKSRQFSGQVDFVGASWNDRISSVVVQCTR